MTEPEARLDVLEARLQAVEDQLAIQRLIASYGPLVDAADAEAVAALWAEDGTYLVEEWQMRNRAEVGAMVAGPEHGGLVASGCAHFLGPAVVTVDGDSALAVCESALLVHRGGRFHLARVGANRFHLVRTGEGWRIQDRVTHVLDGSEEGRDLLRLEDRGRTSLP